MNLRNVRSVCVVLAAVMMMCTPAATAQDLLGLFLDGASSSMSTGGNPFSTWGSLVHNEQSGSAIAKPYVSFDFHGDNIYREVHQDGTQTAFQRFTREADVYVPITNDAYSPAIRLNLSSTNSELCLGQTPTEQANYDASMKQLTLNFEMPIGSALRAGVSFGRSLAAIDNASDLDCSVSYELKNGITLGAKIGRWNTRQYISIGYDGINGLLPLDAARSGGEIEVAVPSGIFVFRGEGEIYGLSAYNDAVREFDTRFSPDGTDARFELVASALVSNEWTMMLTAERAFANGKGILFSENRTYGAVDAFNYGNGAIQLSSEYKSGIGEIFEADVKYRSLAASCNGYGEDWPFTGLFQSPIPIRENVNLNGALRSIQLHAGWLKPFASWISWGIGASAVRILPTLDVDSWESEYIVFGVRGYKERALTVNQIDAAILSTGLNLHLASFKFFYSITQFVPIGIRRKTLVGKGEIGSSTSGSTRSSGGQFHLLSVEYEL